MSIIQTSGKVINMLFTLEEIIAVNENLVKIYFYAATIV